MFPLALVSGDRNRVYSNAKLKTTRFFKVKVRLDRFWGSGAVQHPFYDFNYAFHGRVA